MTAPTRLLSPVEVAGLLRVTVPLLRAEVAALSDELLAWHPAPGEWCIKEVLGHLIEAERRGFAGRIPVILESRDPHLQPWDQDAVARERRDCARAAAALLDELGTLREEGAAFAASLRPADLSRGGHHPRVGYLRVNDILHEWVHHDRNHVRQILGNVQAFVWPAMGAAQAFSRA